MQNILGASNVLDPAESNIEEILQAILYNTPYTKEAEFEIEKILLAIKNNGTYDGEGESRDMKILIAILNDLDYTEEAESRIEELFIEWLHQRSSIKVLEGIPPLTFTANGQPLIDYLISGNTVQSGTPTPDNPIMPQGTGERTGNLAPPLTEWVDGYVNSGTGTIHTPSETREKSSDFIRVEPNRVYVFSHENGDFPSGDSGAWRVAGLYDSNKQFISRAGSANPLYLTITATAETAYIRLSFRTYGGSGNVMLNLGSTALPYEPYGYKIPISCGGETNTIYLDTPLYDGNSISMADTGIEIPTINGQNTLAVDTTVQPEKVYIEYK